MMSSSRRLVLACAVVVGAGCTTTVGPPAAMSTAGAGGTGTAGGMGTAGAGGTVNPATLAPGRSPLRRLTRVEYDNTVYALLGDKSNPALQFEPDTIADGFTNNADTQNVGTSLAQQYLTAAESLSVTATKDLPKLLGCDPMGQETACVRSFVTQFGQRAWRRPLETAEVDRLVAVFAKGRLDFDVATSTQMVLQVMLLSPAFLYRLELGAGASSAGTTVPLTSWEMASRLSYFLLGSMPDEPLFALAARDALRTPAQVATAAQAMIAAASPPAQDRMAQFFTEWLHLINVDKLQKDVVAFPSFTPALGPLMRQETETFVKKTLFGGPGDLKTLLTAPYTYASPELAQLYGAPPPDATGRVTLNPQQRAGLLTQAAFLATQAKSDSTDPVHRGKFIWEGLFCGLVPAPPANVNITPPVITPGTTARQRFEQHRAAASCATCHVVMDPIGLTLEHYDGLGRWRDTENGLTIDVSGELKHTDVDGPFVGAVALATKLASSPQVATCAVRQLFRFGFGRYDTDEDGPTIDYLAAGFQTSKQRFVDLAVSMTQVPAFLQRQVNP
jgi:hypothetical protein